MLQPWIEKGYGCIQLCATEEFRISAISSHEERSVTDLNGIEIPLTVCSMESDAGLGPGSATCSSSSNYDEGQPNSHSKRTDSPLLCFPVPYSFSAGGPQGSWRVLISLHVSADPFVACGLRPIEGLQEFYLPIGWVDGVVKQSPQRNPPSNVGHRSRTTRESDRVTPQRIDSRYQPSYTENVSIHSSYQTQKQVYSPGHMSSRVQSYFSHPSHSPQSAIMPHHFIRPAMAFYPMQRGPQNMEGLQLQHAGGHTIESNLTHQINNAPHGLTQGQGQSYSNVGRPSVSTERSYAPQHHPQSQHKQQKGKLPHPGDWICSTCDALVFSFRPTCYNCHSPQHSSDHHVTPRQPPKTAERPEGDLRDGDWICPGCQGHNFSSKIACFTCRMPRTPSALSSLATQGTERDGAEGPVRPQTVMPGDWTCPTCKENVFAKRHRCYKCSTSKPR